MRTTKLSFNRRAATQTMQATTATRDKRSSTKPVDFPSAGYARR
ncbi:hypothetical protein [Bradyrhizobium sp. NC92]|nr:hypothetical protein [Bradyrhizobium sp. NC92]UWU68035.1 hypothetical protein N2602_33690 [Bradyrhizobium sp. NC92]